MTKCLPYPGVVPRKTKTSDCQEEAEESLEEITDKDNNPQGLFQIHKIGHKHWGRNNRRPKSSQGDCPYYTVEVASSFHMA